MPARTAPHFRRRNSAIPRGAAAIEFAFIFPLFFLIFYATVSYSMMLLVQMGLNNAAADGTRATIQLVSPLANNQTTFNAAATQEVVRAVQTSLNWLSKDQVAAIVSTIDVRSAPFSCSGRITATSR
jgi:Flp pilus assembly protein TadG